MVEPCIPGLNRGVGAAAPVPAHPASIPDAAVGQGGPDRDRSSEPKPLRPNTRQAQLATMAHELCNPLQPLVSAVAVLMQVQGRSAREASLLAIVDRQTRQLARLVAAMRQVSTCVDGADAPVRLQPVIADDLVRSALDAIEPMARAKCQVVAVHLPSPRLSMDCDEGAIIQALQNLLTNAARYTPAGGTITLTVATPGDRVEFRIEDTGPGIPADQLSSVFEPFFRGHDTDAHGTGLGLGLAVVRHVARQHGGDARAERAGPGLGAAVILTIPRRQRGARQDPRAATCDVPPYGRRPSGRSAVGTGDPG